MFADKLNFLISIVGISGGELASSISLDPSYISRLRHGKRALPKRQHFIEPVAEYFSAHITSDYQKKLICDAMGLTSDWPEDTEKAQNYIVNWLVTDNPRQRDIMRTVVAQLSNSFPLDTSVYIENVSDLDKYREDDREIYFGIDGKQEAFLRFLTLAIDSSDSNEIQMFCNEDLSWQVEFPDFRSKLLSLLTVYAKLGNKIKIIHSLSEDAEAMLHMLQGWIPVYLTGYLDPYYYPKIREDFYRRTIFVIPGVAAMISSSLHGNTSEGMTFILTDPNAVRVIESEFNYLLSESKPLAKVFLTSDKERLHKLVKEFFNTKADTILVHENLLPFITPESIRQIKGEKVLCCFKSLEKLLTKYRLIDIVSVPNIEKIEKGEVPMPLSEIIGSEQILFTKEEYLKNLRHIIDLIDSEKNYNLFIKDHALKNIFLCVKKDVGIFITKIQGAAEAFYIEQQDIVGLVWDFLQDSMAEEASKGSKEILPALQGLAMHLKSK